MSEKEKSVYHDIMKRLRAKHGERGVNVLAALAIILSVIMVVSLASLYFYGVWSAPVFAVSVALLIFSPFIVAFFLEVFALFAPKRHALWKAGAQNIASRLPEFRTRYEVRKYFRRLSDTKFEEAVAEVYRGYGHKVKVTPPSHDQGVDLFVEDKDGKVHAVQVKKYSHPVGTPTLQGLVGALLGAGADVPVVVTLSHFTQPAELYAQQLGIQLIDGEELINMCLKTRRHIQEIDDSLEGDSQ